MAEPANLSEAIGQVLPDIDRYLAEQDVAVSDRPLQAAITFVLNFVKAVQDKGTPSIRPGDPQEFIASDWFAQLYADVAAWYDTRYPGVTEHSRDDRIVGVVMIAGTPFPMRVPTVRTRPGSSDTVWINFPDGVRDDEQALDWVETPPNFSTLSSKEHRDAGNAAHDIAHRLRTIRTGLMGTTGQDTKFSGLKAGVLPRLRRAAELLLERDAESVQHAYWELQLAIEGALKALSQQQTGTFIETHDLFRLYDALTPAPGFSRDLLNHLPRWKEMMNLRYGQGTPQNRAECFQAYAYTLTIVAGAVSSMEKMGVGQAEFEIGRPPWTAKLK